MSRSRQLLAAAFVLLCSPGGAAVAQVTPPNIKKPIETARKVSNRTSDQMKEAERAGEGSMAAQKAGEQAAQAPQQAPQKAAAPAKGAPQKGAARGDTGAAAEAGRQRSAVTVYREAFSYEAGGRRDPFLSLMLTGELRPVLTDLVVTGILFDARPGFSIAMLVDNSTGESYGVRVGQTLGRMRVARIGLEEVTFDIEEFGLSRSETLKIDKTRKAAGPGRP